MVNFPKKLCLEVNNLLQTNTAVDVYNEYKEKFEQHVLDNNTTKQLANYIVNQISTNS